MLESTYCTLRELCSVKRVNLLCLCWFNRDGSPEYALTTNVQPFACVCAPMCIHTTLRSVYISLYVHIFYVCNIASFLVYDAWPLALSLYSQFRCSMWMQAQMSYHVNTRICQCAFLSKLHDFVCIYTQPCYVFRRSGESCPQLKPTSNESVHIRCVCMYARMCMYAHGRTRAHTHRYVLRLHRFELRLSPRICLFKTWLARAQLTVAAVQGHQDMWGQGAFYWVKLLFYQRVCIHVVWII
jgi:hypothetical protein